MKEKLTQNDIVLLHLHECGSISSLEAMQFYGIMRLASRISDLNKQGHHIISTTQKSHNRFGEPIHYAVYRFAEEKGE